MGVAKNDERVYTSEDKELYDQIYAILKDDKVAKGITNISIEWCQDQISWGGKYDYILEEICGDET